MIDAEVNLGPTATKAGLLYHYTTQNGLLGIIESNSIWATHAGYLNDASEFKRGLAIARRALDRFKFSSITPEGAGQTTTSSRDEFERVMVEKFRSAFKIVDEMDVFITSFFDEKTSSTAMVGEDPGDVLSQWRAYSQGSSGFSIGFDKAILSNHISQMKSKSRLISCGSCSYDEELQEKHIQERVAQFGSSILGQLYSFIENFAKERTSTALDPLRAVVAQPSDEKAEKLAEIVASRIVGFTDSFFELMGKEFERIDKEMIVQLADLMIPLAFIKHPSFGAENEWRIAQFDFRPKSQIRFRQGPSSLIPYLEIHLPVDDPNSSLIKRIVIGPSPKIDEAVSAAKMLLRCKGYKLKEYGNKAGIEVVPSQLPFRSW